MGLKLKELLSGAEVWKFGENGEAHIHGHMDTSAGWVFFVMKYMYTYYIYVEYKLYLQTY